MDLNEIIARKRTELAKVQRELDALLLAKRISEEMTAAVAAESERSKKQQKSQPEYLEEVLREQNRAMHVKDLAPLLSVKLGKKISPDYVSSLVYRELKKSRRFRKVEGASNTFALREWPTGHGEQALHLSGNGQVGLPIR